MIYPLLAQHAGGTEEIVALYLSIGLFIRTILFVLFFVFWNEINFWWVELRGNNGCKKSKNFFPVTLPPLYNEYIKSVFIFVF